MIRNNVARQKGHAVYAISAPIPASLVVDHNLSWNGGGNIAKVEGKGTTSSLATFQSWTGFDRHGVAAIVDQRRARDSRHVRRAAVEQTDPSTRRAGAG
jgi:hypothetical protein